MTSMNSTENIDMILYMLGFGGLFMGVFYVLYNELLTSVSYITISSL